jgi:hypothetical protein
VVYSILFLSAVFYIMLLTQLLVINLNIPEL